MAENIKAVPDGQGLDYWVQRLSKAELPVLGGVMRDINRLTGGKDASATELSEVILQDAALTQKVLRIANSVHFRGGSNQEISTISRAVVQLGFKGIRAICLSVMLIDSLLKKQSREHMLEWLGRGFNAAVQAETLVRNGDTQYKEDVFVAALLLHVGEMAFWSCRSDSAAALEQTLSEHGISSEESERQLLGTTMKEITTALAAQWEMGDTLREALEPGEEPSGAARAVMLGDEVSLASEQGWDCEALEAALDKVAAHCGLSREEARNQVLRGAEEAAAMAVSYGANKVCNYIPSTTDAVPRRDKQKLTADPQLQLKILRELGNLVNEQVDANTLFQMLVEGIHRGVGFERVALCLLDPRQHAIQAKYVLGEDTAHWREQLRFPVKGEQDNLLAYCVHSRQSICNRAGQRSSPSHLVDAKLASLLQLDNCVMGAIYSPRRSIGVLLADRGMDGDNISQDQAESFAHFVQQANMGLSVLAGNKP